MPWRCKLGMKWEWWGHFSSRCFWQVVILAQIWQQFTIILILWKHEPSHSLYSKWGRIYIKEKRREIQTTLLWNWRLNGSTWKACSKDLERALLMGLPWTGLGLIRSLRNPNLNLGWYLGTNLHFNKNYKWNFLC